MVSTRAHTPSIWADAEELPRAGTADTTKAEARARLLRRYAIASMVLLPFALLAAVLGFAGAGSSQPDAAGAGDVGQQSVASAAVVRWLDADPAPLPGARLLTWDAMRVLSSTPAGDPPGSQAARLESHTLTVLTGTGVRVQVQVLVRVSGQSVQVAGAPSLQMLTPEAGGAVDIAAQWPGTSQATPSDEVKRAVQAWAAAFTSGDPAALRLQIGDPDGTHTYLPLPGMQPADPDVGAGAWLTEDGSSSGVKTGQMVVRVSIPLTWTGVPQDRGARSSVGFADYDVLVVDATTAAPRVVAWGGPGTGPSLTPFVNAVAGADASGSSPQQDERLAPTPEGTSATTGPSSEPTPARSAG